VWPGPHSLNIHDAACSNFMVTKYLMMHGQKLCELASKPYRSPVYSSAEETHSFSVTRDEMLLGISPIQQSAPVY